MLLQLEEERGTWTSVVTCDGFIRRCRVAPLERSLLISCCKSTVMIRCDGAMRIFPYSDVLHEWCLNQNRRCMPRIRKTARSPTIAADQFAVLQSYPCLATEPQPSLQSILCMLPRETPESHGAGQMFHGTALYRWPAFFSSCRIIQTTKCTAPRPACSLSSTVESRTTRQ